MEKLMKLSLCMMSGNTTWHSFLWGLKLLTLLPVPWAPGEGLAWPACRACTGRLPPTQPPYSRAAESHYQHLGTQTAIFQNRCTGSTEGHPQEYRSRIVRESRNVRFRENNRNHIFQILIWEIHWTCTCWASIHTALYATVIVRGLWCKCQHHDMYWSFTIVKVGTKMRVPSICPKSAVSTWV